MSALIIVGYGTALLVGAVLGVLGAGGATITVPIFVYLFQVPPKVATVLSLGVVGGVGLLGLIRAWPRRELDWPWALRVAIPSMAGVWVTRRLIVPLIPASLEFMVMVAFAVLLLFVARAMLKPQSRGQAEAFSVPQFMLRATGVGMVTGLLGAGGGFLIVPMLTEWAGLAFRRAASTSLLVIVFNSGMGLASGWSPELAPWYFTWGIFGVLAGVGLWLGVRGAAKLEPNHLRRIFAYFLLLVSVLTLLIEGVRAL